MSYNPRDLYTIVPIDSRHLEQMQQELRYYKEDIQKYRQELLETQHALVMERGRPKIFSTKTDEELKEVKKELGKVKRELEIEKFKTEMVGEFLEMEHFVEENVNTIGQITDLAVKRALALAEGRWQEMKVKVETQLDELITKRPVFHIKLNDIETQKLTARKSKHLARLVVNAKLGINTLLVGPAGCGKTTVAHQLAEALGLQFGSVCLTAGASETWLFGRQTPTGFIEGAFSKLYREGGVFLADEMDAADANLLLSINTALSHSEMLNPMNGEVIKKHENFVFVGAANTNGKGATHLYTGRARLDAATLDRMVIINVDYDAELEEQLCPDKHMHKFLINLRAQLKSAGFDEFVSTRAFIACYKQSEAGVPYTEIVDSIASNWGDGAKKLSKKCYDIYLSGRSLPSKGSSQKLVYQEFIESHGETKKPLTSQEVPF